MGFKSPVEIPNMKMKKPPSEANSRRVTDRVKEGYGNDLAALAALPHAKPHLMDGAQRSQNCELMNKNRIEGRHGAMSWHNTATATEAIATS